MHRIAETLVEEGHDVSIVGRLLSDSSALNTKKFKQHRLFCFFSKGFLFYAAFNIRLFFYLLFQKVDLIGAVDLDSILAVYYASRIKGIKRSFDAHELFPEVPELVHRKLVKRVWEYIERTYMKKFSLRYTVSDSIANYYKEKYQLHFDVIRNLPNPYHPIPNENAMSKPYIFYQGALNDGRGLAEMIEAMKDIHHYDLKIAGEGDLSQPLRALVDELKLQNKVHFLGKLAPTALRTYTQGASIGLNLLENKGLSYYYSLANKFFDYIQAGIPGISMNFPEYAAINAAYEVAVLIDDLSVSSIVHAVQSIEEHGERLRLNCRQASVLYCWEEEKKIVQKLYRDCFA